MLSFGRNKKPNNGLEPTALHAAAQPERSKINMKIESDPSFPVSPDAILRVEGKEKVFDFLGHWPSFADMEASSLSKEMM